MGNDGVGDGSTVCCRSHNTRIGIEWRVIVRQLRHPLCQPLFMGSRDPPRRPPPTRRDPRLRSCRSLPAARRAPGRRRPRVRFVASTSLLRCAGSSVEWMMVLPFGIAMAEMGFGERAADAQDHVGFAPKISATARGTARPPEPSDKRMGFRK